MKLSNLLQLKHLVNDLRYGISLLSEAGEKAEEEGSTKILEEHVLYCALKF